MSLSAVSSSSIPLLFGKRSPVPPTMAAQYVGTDTEIDTKLPRSNHVSETRCTVQPSSS